MHSVVANLQKQFAGVQKKCDALCYPVSTGPFVGMGMSQPKDYNDADLETACFYLVAMARVETDKSEMFKNFNEFLIAVKEALRETSSDTAARRVQKHGYSIELPSCTAKTAAEALNRLKKTFEKSSDVARVAWQHEAIAQSECEDFCREEAQREFYRQVAEASSIRNFVYG
jgi:deoxyribodipyrimidine photolyase